MASKSPHRPGISDTHIRFFRRQNFSHLHTILDLPEAGLFVANDQQVHRPNADEEPATKPDEYWPTGAMEHGTVRITVAGRGLETKTK